MGKMKKGFLTAILYFSIITAWAQVDSSHAVYPKSELVTHNKFIYRLMSQEYLTNENDYFLGVTNDTMYLHFEKVAQPAVYKITRSLKDDAIVPVLKKDTLLHMPLVVSFLPNGKIDSL